MQPLLRIDLSNREISEYIIPQEWEQEYLGGASLGARILYDSLTKDLDPFSNDSPLLFLCGPLTGTVGPAVGRFVVCGKSPATMLWAESNCGGSWGPRLRFSGYDGIWITGKSENKIYLSIINGKIEFHDAEHLWGEDTYSIQNKIKYEIDQNKASVINIGIAGENKVYFSGLFCDHGRTAGRTGLGAVMGSKNLKAIAVNGEKVIPVHNWKTFNELRSLVNKDLKNDFMTQVASDLGTASVADYSDYLGIMPKKYYSIGTFDGSGAISGSKISETILRGKKACHGCLIACGRVVDLGDGINRKGPEYETLVSFGPNLLIDDISTIGKFNELCDYFGLDTISTANVIGLAFSLYEQGVLTKKETEGLELTWGNIEAVKTLIHLIAHRNGIGNIMADGSRVFAEKWGKIEEAVQVNGLEIAAHDPRGSSGMAIVYASSPRGACHNKSDYFFVDWGQADESLGLKYYSRQAGAEKAGNVARHQNYRSVFDSLVMCFFANVPLDSIVRLLNLAVGRSYSSEDLFLIGERAWNLKRCINIRMGYDPKNEKLPRRIVEPYPDGGSADYVIPFTEMMKQYYKERDWNFDNGIPNPGILDKLGLHQQRIEFFGEKKA